LRLHVIRVCATCASRLRTGAGSAPSGAASEPHCCCGTSGSDKASELSAAPIKAQQTHDKDFSPCYAEGRAKRPCLLRNRPMIQMNRYGPMLWKKAEVCCLRTRS